MDAAIFAMSSGAAGLMDATSNVGAVWASAAIAVNTRLTVNRRKNFRILSSTLTQFATQCKWPRVAMLIPDKPLVLGGELFQVVDHQHIDGGVLDRKSV